MDKEKYSEAIRKSFRESSGLATASFLEKNSGVPLSEVQNFLNKDQEVRTSFLRSSEGESVYYLDTWFNRIKEFFVALKYLNYLKF